MSCSDLLVKSLDRPAVENLFNSTSKLARCKVEQSCFDQWMTWQCLRTFRGLRDIQKFTAFGSVNVTAGLMTVTLIIRLHSVFSHFCVRLYWPKVSLYTWFCMTVIPSYFLHGVMHQSVSWAKNKTTHSIYGSPWLGEPFCQYCLPPSVISMDISSAAERNAFLGRSDGEFSNGSNALSYNEFLGGCVEIKSERLFQFDTRL